MQIGLWKECISLTKPGIIRSNLLSTFTGFWVASRWNISWGTTLWLMIGITFTLSSSCVFNNLFDREFDGKMERTQQRPLPAGRLKPTFVFWYASILGISGIFTLFWFTNALAGWLAIMGMFIYDVVYTLWLKRTSTWSTSVGAISGAMPPVIGYTSVTEQLDIGAMLLFLILFLWQPPHFWALGIRRVEEYRHAGYPLLPVVKGIIRTKRQMIPYVVLLFPVIWMFYAYGYVGWLYSGVGIVINLIWLYICITGLTTKNDEIWAKRNFLFSINWLLIHLFFLILDTMGNR